MKTEKIKEHTGAIDYEKAMLYHSDRADKYMDKLYDTQKAIDETIDYTRTLANDAVNDEQSKAFVCVLIKLEALRRLR